MLDQAIATSKEAMPFAQRRWLFLLVLTLMSMAGLVGSDAYIPMLPTMGKVFHQNSHAMQLTLGIYFFGLSIGQLIYGPLTDSFGRKKLIIFGMALYCIASIFCAFSISYTQMLIFRFLQAFGACSGLIIGRAIVGDIFDTKEAGKIFSTIFPFIGMSPSISPVIGGFLGYYFGWQSVFIFISQFAIAVALLTVWYLPETLDLGKRQPLRLRKILLTYPQVLLNRKFIAYASAPCTAYIAYFAYIAASPFIFYSHGFSERAIGTFYITLSLTYVAGNLLGKRLLNSFSLDNLIRIGYIVFNVGGFLFLISGIFDLPLYVMVATISIVAFGNGLLIPLGTAGVISSFSKSIGYASGLLGFLQLGLVAVSTGIVGILSDNSILGLGIYIFSVTLLGLITFTSALKSSC